MKKEKNFVSLFFYFPFFDDELLPFRGGEQLGDASSSAVGGKLQLSPCAWYWSYL
jgi:hypothetical protein